MSASDPRVAAWPIGTVARTTGVTTRTLRHYDEIGLLRPAWTADDGHRWYGREELLRLQRILLLRELDVDLPTIADIVDRDVDEIAALRRHLDTLTAARDRVIRMAATVERTIAALVAAQNPTADELFAGFADRRGALRATLVERFGSVAATHFDDAELRTTGWEPADHTAAVERGDALDDELVELLDHGHDPDSAEVLAVVDRLLAGVEQFWSPDRDSFTGLADHLADDPAQRARDRLRHPELTSFRRLAMHAFAELRMSPAEQA